MKGSGFPRRIVHVRTCRALEGLGLLPPGFRLQAAENAPRKRVGSVPWIPCRGVTGPPRRLVSVLT